MMSKLVLVVLSCVCYVLVMQPIPSHTAAAGFTGDQPTETRAKMNGYQDEMDNSAAWPASGISFETSPDQLSPQMADYANMVENDVLMLENPFDTTMPKRSNLMKRNHAVANPNCACNFEEDLIFLGNDFIPKMVQSKKCVGGCAKGTRCDAVNYWVPVLKRTRKADESQIKVPTDMDGRWVGHFINVTAACVCSNSYLTSN